MKNFVIVFLLTYSFGCEIDKAPSWVCSPPENTVVGYDKDNEQLAIANAKVELAEMKQIHVYNSMYHKESSDGDSITTEKSLLTTKFSTEYEVLHKWQDKNFGIYVLVIMK